MTRGRAAIAALLLAVAGVLPACAPGGGGGGSGASSASAAAGGGVIRLVGFDRRALSPSASPRLSLVAERPAGAQPSDFILEESHDGRAFVRATLLGTPVAHATALVFEVAVPGGPRHYRLAAPAPSNIVAVLAGAGSPAPIALVAPRPGASAVSRDPLLATVGGAGASSFLYAIADAEGTLVWLAEAAAPSLAPSMPGAIPFIAVPPGGLAPGAAHVATAVPLDASGFGAAGAPRTAFTTAP